MNGLMMEYPLTLTAIFRRAERLFGRQAVVSRRPDRSLHRYTYAEWADRTRRLAAGLTGLGLAAGDRVATLAWNHGTHLEAYFAIPLMGGVLHTLNLRLHPDELAYIVNHAEDRAVLVDASLRPLWEKVRAKLTHPVHEIAIGADAGSLGAALEYEALVAAAPPLPDRPDPDERTAVAMCYTTGTTGQPKGVLYSHRSLVLHTLALSLSDGMGIGECDAVCPVVPMFHANAWGMPFSAVMSGSKLVMPGPHLDADSLLDLFERERVTVTGGVPTIWLDLLQRLDAAPKAHDLSSLRAMFAGGAAVPQSLIEAYEQRHGLRIVHAWGMTEICPVGTIGNVPPALTGSASEAQYAFRAKQGRPAPFIDLRARDENGLVPWDGRTMGELEVRGAWVAGEYYNRSDCAERFTADGWFKTGDIVTIDECGAIQVQDRSKDVIKSGGEWISSVALECALMGHPAIAEAAVVPVPHPRWGERPLAAVVFKPGASAPPDDLRAFLAPRFPKFWLPEAFVVIDAIPRTSAGKFKKSELRARFRDYRFEETGSPSAALDAATRSSS